MKFKPSWFKPSGFKPSWLLRVACVWTFFVWAVLIKNMVTDEGHELGFRVVHITLAVVSISLAAALWPYARRLDTPS